MGEGVASGNGEASEDAESEASGEGFGSDDGIPEGSGEAYGSCKWEATAQHAAEGQAVATTSGPPYASKPMAAAPHESPQSRRRNGLPGIGQI